jgi:hypothetical protein
MPDALDHRGMVRSIGQHDAIRDLRRKRAQGCPVRDIARGEKKSGFLAMPVSQLLLEKHMLMVRASDIARSTSSRT